MPLSTEQLAKKKAQDPKKFEEERLAMRAFSQYLNRVGDVLFKSDDDGEVKVGRKVLQFRDALEKVSLDPASPRNRDEIDRALDTLFELEGFLGSPASDESGNTCGQIIFADPRDDIDALRSGLRTFNSFCGFQLDENALINGRIYKPTEKEKEEKRQALKDWHEQRSLEREETLRRERAAAEAEEKKQQEAARKRQEEFRRGAGGEAGPIRPAGALIQRGSRGDRIPKEETTMKKLIALFLALALAASLGAAAWAAEDAPADRAAAAVVLWELAGRPVVNYAPGFEDLDAGADYMNAVRWAASEGIIKGYDARTFGPNDPVTREQFAVMIYRYAQSLGLGFRGAWYFPLDYADAGEISDWANEAVHWVVMNGKPEFADGKLQPKASLTHGMLDAIAAAFSRGLAGESAEADIAEKLVGRWTIAERNGQSVLTNAKGVFTFPSPDKAYISASFNSRPELGGAWIHQTEADVAIEGGKVTLTWSADGKTTMADELTVLSITDDEVVGSLTVKQTENGAETIIAEDAIRFVKVGADYSDAILGTWEGHMTSAQSKFGDEEDHRWEYRADGTYVYYEKDGGSWVPGDDTFNEYFVAGNLLCTRWGENGDENREWWEIAIDGDAMRWTALRAGDDGTTYTAAFEMTKVAQ